MLTLTVFLPLVGTLLVALVPQERHALIRAVGLAAAGITLLLIAGLWVAFDPGRGYQFVVRVPWIETLGVSYALRVVAPMFVPPAGAPAEAPEPIAKAVGVVAAIGSIALGLGAFLLLGSSGGVELAW